MRSNSTDYRPLTTDLLIMEKLLLDMRYAIRVLMKRPGFTVIAALTLALGIGANTAIFSVVNGVLLQPLPYPEPERLVTIMEQHGLSRPQRSVSPPNYFDWRDHNQTFSAVTATRGWTAALTGEGEPQRVTGAEVSKEFFPVIGTAPLLGRVFADEDDRSGAGRVVVLGHGLWRSRFGSDPGVVGNSITLNDESFQVIGVMPEGFDFPEGATLWKPLANSFAGVPRGTHFLRVYARLNPGVSLTDAETDMARVTNWIAETYPGSESSFGAVPIPLRELIVGDVRPALLILLGAVGLVLAIACANVANLLLVRAAGREREIAIRLAIGASRARIARQLLCESLLIGLVGGALGLILAAWGVDLLLAFKSADIPRLDEVVIDWKALSFTGAAAVMTAFIFGLAPAIQASRVNFNHSLKEGSRGGGASKQRNRVRNLLVVSEVAISLMLLAGAGLLLKSFVNLSSVDPGFDSENVVTAHISLPRGRYDSPQVEAFYSEVVERLNTLPGVNSAGATSRLPLHREGDFLWQIRVEGDAQEFSDRTIPTAVRIITPGYLETMKVRSQRGRLFARSDSSQSPKVILISDSLARLAWPGEDPTGRRVRFEEGTALPHDETWEIVGVVDSVRDERLDLATRHEVYIPHLQFPARNLALTVRAEGEPAAMMGAIRDAIWSFDSSLPLENMETMESVVSRSLAQPRFNAMLLMIFAGVALLLGVAGIYGVMAYIVAQRTNEFGIRIALGARPRDILKLVTGQCLALTFMGVGLGLAASFALTRFLSSLLYGISPTDPPTFAGISALLIAVSLLACYIPARRAAKTDPMEALRYE